MLLTGQNGNIHASHSFTNALLDSRLVEDIVRAVVVEKQASIAANSREGSDILAKILTCAVTIGANKAKKQGKETKRG